MEGFFNGVWAELMGRVEGPMSLRLLIQPLIAGILAVRGGLRDARENKPPFFRALAFNPERRSELLQQVWKDIGKVFVAAMALDIVYQVVATRSAQIGEAFPIAILLALIPYLLLRAPITRLAAGKRKRR